MEDGGEEASQASIIEYMPQSEQNKNQNIDNLKMDNLQNSIIPKE